MKTKNGFLFLAAGVFTLTASLVTSQAFAMSSLKQIQVSDGSRVDLLFDSRVSRSQIKTEFFRNIIQISVNEASVYPAKISSVSGGALTKIFAYQYAPKLIRCRFTVNGPADSYRNRFSLSYSAGGKMLTVRLAGSVAAPARSESRAKGAIRDADERALLAKVMSSKGPSAAAAMTAPREVPQGSTDKITEKSAAPVPAPESPGIANTENRPLNLDAKSSARSKRLTGASEMPSPLSALGKLAFVVALFSVLALAVKKIWKPEQKIGAASDDTPLLGALGRFARKNLGVKAGSRRMSVEVLSNHHIGPKRSIAVIKVAGQTMVVGITEQSINLISRLSNEPTSEEEALNALAEMDNPPLEDVVTSPPQASLSPRGAEPAVFSKLLQSEAAKPALGAPIVNTPSKMARPKADFKDVRVTSYGASSAGETQVKVSPQAAMGLSGVRAQIRSKLEGLKQI